MMSEDRLEGDGGDVLVVVPQRTVHMDELFPGAKPITDASPARHKQEVRCEEGAGWDLLTTCQG